MRYWLGPSGVNPRRCVHRSGGHHIGELRSVAMLKEISRHRLGVGIALLSMSWAIVALDAAPALAASTNSWTAAANMSTARFGASATALLDGRVLLAGGYDASAEIYD